MKKVCYTLPLLLFTLFTGYLLVMGVFFWDGGNTAYLNTNLIVRGLQMAGTVLLCLLVVGWISRQSGRLSEKKLLYVTGICGAVMVIGQFAFVTLAETGIRYDSLKVVEEATALFHQEGIGMADLDGYFARYSNNYAITIFTHLLLKVWKGIGLLHSDFSNAVILLQYCNILFVDMAFAGVWAFLKKYQGIRAAGIFLIYMLLNPLSYVWLPFYYTNTVAMPFGVWGMYLLFAAWENTTNVLRLPNGKKYKSVGIIVCQWLLAGVLFAMGFKIRATVVIVLIAVLITLFVLSKKENNGRERKQPTCIAFALGVFLFVLSMAMTGGVYQAVENHYLAFDKTDTEFPATHWIAMGLSDTGTFSPLDEAYTESFETAEEKKEATLAQIQQRVADHGIAGVAKLYMKKLADTFGDGAGGYHSELNISRDYGTLWQVVYGVYRDPLLWITQCWYLVSILSGFGMVYLLWKKKVNRRLFVIPLTLLGSYLFQMLWEAGTIYSISTMYLNGAVTAVCFGALREAGLGSSRNSDANKNVPWWIIGLVCALSVGFRFAGTDYVDVSMSVDQFLFQADEYIALSGEEEITQTFSTDKYFSTIALQAHNPEGDSNDSRYSVTLYDSQGGQIGEQILEAKDMGDYTFYPMAFEAAEGNQDYMLKIHKIAGENSLVFLYYNTGNYDAYKGGYMTGLHVSDKADLAFRVYWREEPDEN